VSRAQNEREELLAVSGAKQAELLVLLLGIGQLVESLPDLDGVFYGKFPGHRYLFFKGQQVGEALNQVVSQAILHVGGSSDMSEDLSVLLDIPKRLED